MALSLNLKFVDCEGSAKAVEVREVRMNENAKNAPIPLFNLFDIHSIVGD